MIKTLRELGLFSRRATAAANHEFVTFGLNNNRFQYLLRVCEQPGLFFDALATEMAVDRTTSYRAVQKLIADGYLEKRPDATNKKVRRLYPTEKATEIYPTLHSFEKQVAMNSVGRLSEGERQLLGELLAKINQGLEK